jgi:hypothetical protein
MDFWIIGIFGDSPLGLIKVTAFKDSKKGFPLLIFVGLYEKIEHIFSRLGVWS